MAVSLKEVAEKVSQALAAGLKAQWMGATGLGGGGGGDGSGRWLCSA